jgi:hypothetical protein
VVEMMRAHAAVVVGDGAVGVDAVVSPLQPDDHSAFYFQ